MLFNTTILTELPSAWLIAGGITTFIILQSGLLNKALGIATQTWVKIILDALKKPLILAFLGYAVCLILAWLVLRVSIDEQQLLRFIDKVQDVINFTASFWFVFRLIRLSLDSFYSWSEAKGIELGKLIAPVLKRTLQIIAGLMLIDIAISYLDLTQSQQLMMVKLLKLCSIAAVAWLAAQVVLITDQVLRNRYAAQSTEDVDARKIYTETHVFKKVLLLLIGVIALACMFMTFDNVREIGQSILASAGIASIIAGIAAQRSLAGIFAGLQIAISQPIRIGDTIVLEGELGQVEEINLTYVVIKLWDLRRLILPVNYFMEKPFQNWTRNSTKLLASIFFYVDYTAPIAELRKIFEDIVKNSANWDGGVCTFQVSEIKQNTLEIRGLVSAADGGKGWDLRCETREKMIDILQKKYAYCLPKQRQEMARDMQR